MLGWDGYVVGAGGDVADGNVCPGEWDGQVEKTVGWWPGTGGDADGTENVPGYSG